MEPNKTLKRSYDHSGHSGSINQKKDNNYGSNANELNSG